MNMPMRAHLLIFANITLAERTRQTWHLATPHRVIYSCGRVTKTPRTNFITRNLPVPFRENRCCPIEINHNKASSLVKILHKALDLAINTKPYLPVFVRLLHWGFWRVPNGIRVGWQKPNCACWMTKTQLAEICVPGYLVSLIKNYRGSERTFWCSKDEGPRGHTVAAALGQGSIVGPFL